jgi:hypothetical protein
MIFILVPILAIALVVIFIVAEIKIKRPAFRIMIAVVACFMCFFAGGQVGWLLSEFSDGMARNRTAVLAGDALNTLELQANAGELDARKLLKFMREKLPTALFQNKTTDEFFLSPELVGKK